MKRQQVNGQGSMPWVKKKEDGTKKKRRRREDERTERME